MKIQESENRDQYLDLAREQNGDKYLPENKKKKKKKKQKNKQKKKTMEHERDGNTSCK